MFKRVAIAAALAAVTGSAQAAPVAYTSFEEPGTAPRTTSNPLGSGTGLSYSATGGELGFSSSWSDTRSTGAGGPVVGSESGDFLGVTSFTGEVGAFTDGTQGYQWNDADGLLTLTLDPVDLTGYRSSALSFDLFVAGTGYEADDSFSVWADGASLLSLGETELEGSLGDSWTSFDLSLGAFDGSMVTVAFGGDTNSGSENFYLDNVRFDATVVPVPAAVWLLGAGVVALVGLGRRRAGGASA